MKRLPEETLQEKIQERLSAKGITIEKEILDRALSLIVERIEKFEDITLMLESGELDFLFKDPEYDPSKLLWKGTSKETTRKHLEKIIEELKVLKYFEDGPMPANQIDRKTTIHGLVFGYVRKEPRENGIGEVLWPIRVALTGRDKSPDPIEIIAIIGKEKTLARLHKAIELLSHQ